MTTELQTTEQTAQALIQILTLNKNTGAALEKLLKLPLLDADNKIPAGVLRIVGALSQGYIIESGDNAIGYYVRFANGTQICIISKDLSITCTNISSPIAYASLGTFVYPAEFSSRPAILGAMTEQVGSDARGYVTFGDVASDAFLSMTPHVHYYRVMDATTVPVHLNILAIGKWK